MTQKTLLKLAWQSILKNKMRTVLTMLGIVIGVGAVIVMVAVGYGAQSADPEADQQPRHEPDPRDAGRHAAGRREPGRRAPSTGSRSRTREKLKREGTMLAAVSPVIFARQVVIGPAGNWRTIDQRRVRRLLRRSATGR